MARSREGSTVNTDAIIKKYSALYPPGEVEALLTGSIALDYFLGGGFPRGRVVTISSSPGIGKTTVAMHMVRSMLNQYEDAIILYVDSERALDESLKVAVLGEDYKLKFKDRFVHVSLNAYEDVVTMLLDFAKTGALYLVIIDSETSLQPKSVLAGENDRIGAKATAQNLFCLQMKIFTDTSKFGLLYIDQERANIQMTGGRPSSLTKSAGGFAFHHYNDIHLSMRPRQMMFDKLKNKVGAWVKVVSEKNKRAGNRSGFMVLKYGYGISNIATLQSILEFSGACVQAGSYFRIQNEYLDLGEGMGAQVTVQGRVGLENLVTQFFDHIYETYRSMGMIEKYFQEFAFVE